MLNKSQQDALWDAFYALAPDGCQVSEPQRQAMLTLIATAPITFRRLLWSDRTTEETVGVFQRADVQSLYFIIRMMDDGATCMADFDKTDLEQIRKTEIKKGGMIPS